MPPEAVGVRSEELRQRFESLLKTGRETGMSEEAVKTQVFAVAYFLR